MTALLGSSPGAVSADWPHRGLSRTVATAGISWHVQIAGDGPVALLVHGTAASTHSWRGLLPILARRFTVVAMDLPGHAYTRLEKQGTALTLPFMAQSIGALVRNLGVEPAIAIGHSAGAALVAHAALEGLLSARAIVGLNAAVLPFRGIGRHLFPWMARMMMLNPFTPDFFTWRAGRQDAVRNLIESTGSSIDEEGLAIYQRLLRDRRHVSAALNMMANWDLEQMARSLPDLKTPLTLIAASNDRAVPADDAWRVKEMVPRGEVKSVQGLGHLAHEEEPERIAGLILNSEAASGCEAASGHAAGSGHAALLSATRAGAACAKATSS